MPHGRKRKKFNTIKCFAEVGFLAVCLNFTRCIFGKILIFLYSCVIMYPWKNFYLTK